MWVVVECRVCPGRSGIRTFCSLKAALLCSGGTSKTRPPPDASNSCHTLSPSRPHRALDHPEKVRVAVRGKTDSRVQKAVGHWAHGACHAPFMHFRMPVG